MEVRTDDMSCALQAGKWYNYLVLSFSLPKGCSIQSEGVETHMVLKLEWKNCDTSELWSLNSCIMNGVKILCIVANCK